MSQAEFKKRLKVLMNKPENQVCSDCPERQPRWASLIVPPPGSQPGSTAIGAFTCLECSGSHRRLGVHIAFVRSVTLDSWKEKEVLAMENGGNQKVNAIFEANLSVSKPTTSATGPVRERFIRDKYERRKYFSAAALQSYVDEESSDSESDDEQQHQQQQQRSTVRAPSEAAKMRAQARKQRNKLKAPSSSSSSSHAVSSSPRKQSAAVQRRQAAKAPAPAPVAPVMDLLDFGLPVTNDPGPPPNPPSASPSPTLDMFKQLSVSGGGVEPNPPTASTATTNTIHNGNVNVPDENQNAAVNSNNDRKKKIDDIMGLFNTPANNNNMGFDAFGSINNNGNSMPMGNHNMNNGMMMQNQMAMQQNNMNNNMNGMNGMMNNQMMQNSQYMNNTINSNVMNSYNTNSNKNNMNNNTQSMGQNMSFFNGMQTNMNNSPTNKPAQYHSQMNTGMSMQQNQVDYGMAAPMGGTPSNLNVLGGQSTSGSGSSGMVHQNFTQQSFGGHNGGVGGGESKNGFDVMGGSANNNGGGNPQMNQFASFGSFR